MNITDAIKHAQRLVSDCAVSPPHLMPSPSVEQRDAISALIDVAKSRLEAALDRPDMSGCA